MQCFHKSAGLRSGITFPETLVVLGLLGLLLQLLLPSLLAVRDSSRRTQCESQLMQIGQALAQCESAHKVIPQAAGYFPGDAPKESKEKPAADKQSPKPPATLGSIHYFLLPYIGEDRLYMCWRGSTQSEVFLDQNPNGIPPALYLCPSDQTTIKPGIVALPGSGRQLGVTSYAANVQGLGHWWEGKEKSKHAQQPHFDKKLRRSDFPDGGAKTIAFAERYQVCPDSGRSRPGWLGTMPTRYDPVFAWNKAADEPLISLPQIAPAIDECDPDTAQTAHAGGMNVLMIDGGTRRVSGSISESAWKSMLMRGDMAEASKEVR